MFSNLNVCLFFLSVRLVVLFSLNSNDIDCGQFLTFDCHFAVYAQDNTDRVNTVNCKIYQNEHNLENNSYSRFKGSCF